MSLRSLAYSCGSIIAFTLVYSKFWGNSWPYNLHYRSGNERRLTPTLDTAFREDIPLRVSLYRIPYLSGIPEMYGNPVDILVYANRRIHMFPVNLVNTRYPPRQCPVQGRLPLERKEFA